MRCEAFLILGILASQLSHLFRLTLLRRKFQDEGVHAERLELNAAVYAKIRARISDARESARMLAEEGKVDTG
jgi:hypothetical protein